MSGFKSSSYTAKTQQDLISLMTTGSFASLSLVADIRLFLSFYMMELQSELFETRNQCSDIYSSSKWSMYSSEEKKKVQVLSSSSIASC